MYGKKIKWMREHYGYSQRELANKIGVPPSTISFWEKSEYPSLEGIVKICNAFNLNIWEFFIDDHNELKKILPSFITIEDATLIKIINTESDFNTRSEIKKAFVSITKAVLAHKPEIVKQLPVYEKKTNSNSSGKQGKSNDFSSAENQENN